MKLTKGSSYALHAVAYLAANKPEKAMASHNLAKECHVESDRFLLKILRMLVTNGVLTAIKGPTGGYRLARNPGQITMLEIVEAVDGPIKGTAPLGSTDADGALPLNAKLSTICTQTAEQLRKSLEKVKISDLLKS